MDKGFPVSKFSGQVRAKSVLGFRRADVLPKSGRYQKGRGDEKDDFTFQLSLYISQAMAMSFNYHIIFTDKDLVILEQFFSM